MALLVAVPLLTLVLIRMLWSGSSLWFLTVGLILLGIAAVIFLARRPAEPEYGQNALTQESNRLPLVLAGIGVLFLAMLLLPNFAGGGSGGGALPTLEGSSQNNTTGGGLTSGVAGSQQGGIQTQPTAAPAAQQPAAQQPAAGDTTTGDSAATDDTAIDNSDTTTDTVVPDGSQTYVVADGDTLWDIAATYDTSVDAIILANGLDNPSDIQIGQELIIPPPEDNGAATDDSAAQ
jgi:LysM repeat protein